MARGGFHRASTIALASVIGISTILMMVYHNRFWAPADEGNYAHVAERLLEGQVLHRDVQDVHAGYVNFINAAAFSVFGLRMVSMRYPLAVLTIVQSGLMFLLLRQRGIVTAVIGALALTALSFVQFLNPTANWYSLFLTIATIAWLWWIPPGHRTRHFGAGLLVGTTFLFRQLSGVFLAVGVLVFLLLERQEALGNRRRAFVHAVMFIVAMGLATYLLRTTDPVGWVLVGVWPLPVLFHAWRRTQMCSRELASSLLGLSLGVVTSALPMIAYHVVHGSVRDWFSDSFAAALSLPALDFIKRPGYLMMGILAWRGFHSGELATQVNAAYWTVLLLLSAMLGILLLYTLVHSHRPSIHPLPVIACFYTLVSLHYQLPIYLYYTVGLSLAALLILMAELRGPLRKVALSAAVSLAAVGLYYQAAMPLSRHLQGDVAGKRRFPHALLRSPVAGIYVDTADAVLYGTIIELAERETQPGDSIFALPTNAELYFLTRRTNPFRFYNTALGIRSSADLDSVIHTIRCYPPKLVFYDSLDKYNTPASAQIAALVEVRYQRLATIHPFQVFRRVSDRSEGNGNEPGCGSPRVPDG